MRVSKVRLLKEFFAQMGNPMDLEKHLGVLYLQAQFMLLDPKPVQTCCSDNNSFLQMVIMVPLRDFQHTTFKIPFSTDNTMDIEQMTLYDLVIEQPWCISLEKMTTPNKVLLLMTYRQLEMARKWSDATLPTI